MDEVAPLRLVIPLYGAAFLSMNDTRQMHWRKLHKAQELLHHVTWLALKQARFPRNIVPTDLLSQLTFATNRRRDPHNYMATLKPIVDELTAYGCWPDDTPEHVSVKEPVLQVGTVPAVSLIFKKRRD